MITKNQKLAFRLAKFVSSQGILLMASRIKWSKFDRISQGDVIFNFKDLPMIEKSTGKSLVNKELAEFITIRTWDGMAGGFTYNQGVKITQKGYDLMERMED